MEYVILIGIIIFIVYKLKSNKKTNIRLQPVTNKANFNPDSIIIDTETTGLILDNSIRVTKKNVIDYSENFPNIVQLSYFLVDKSGFYESETFFIKQTKPIPERTIKIHGITNEICKNKGIEISEMLDKLTKVTRNIKFVVAHNIKFDFKVIHAEYFKENIPFPLNKLKKVDTMNLSIRHFGWKYGAKISLYNAADKLFGKEKSWIELKKNLDKHDAESDAIVAALIYNALRKD